MFVDKPSQVVDAIAALKQHKDKFVWAGFQLEKCESGKRHLQGYVFYKQPRQWHFIKRLLKCKHVHIEECKGSHDDNVAYVTKEQRLMGPWFVAQPQGSQNDDLLSTQEL